MSGKKAWIILAVFSSFLWGGTLIQAQVRVGIGVGISTYPPHHHYRPYYYPPYYPGHYSYYGVYPYGVTVVPRPVYVTPAPVYVPPYQAEVQEETSEDPLPTPLYAPQPYSQYSRKSPTYSPQTAPQPGSKATRRPRPTFAPQTVVTEKSVNGLDNNHPSMSLPRQVVTPAASPERSSTPTLPQNDPPEVEGTEF